MTACSRCSTSHECGTIVHTGEVKIAVQLSCDELESLAFSTPERSYALKLLCALSLIDAQRAETVRREWNDAYLGYLSDKDLLVFGLPRLDPGILKP